MFSSTAVEVAVSNKAQMIASMFHVELPKAIDAGGWEMVLDTVYPILEERPLINDMLLDIAEELLKIAPAAIDASLLDMLRENTKKWANEPEEVSVA